MYWCRQKNISDITSESFGFAIFHTVIWDSFSFFVGETRNLKSSIADSVSVLSPSSVPPWAQNLFLCTILPNFILSFILIFLFAKMYKSLATLTDDYQSAKLAAVIVFVDLFLITIMALVMDLLFKRIS